MLTTNQIEAAAFRIVTLLQDAAQNSPSSALNGVLAVRVSGAVLSEASNAGIWALRNQMDGIAAEVAHLIGAEPEEVQWDVDGRPALGKGYLFNAPAGCFGIGPAADDTLEAAQGREQGLREILGRIFRDAKCINPDTGTYSLLITRDEVAAIIGENVAGILG